MKKFARVFFVFLACAMIVLGALPTGPAQAQDGTDDGADWGDFIDEDGNLNSNLVDAGEVSQDADWMPDFPDWTGIEMDATYHQYVAPDGSTMLAPSATTLFFMAMNPYESGLINVDGTIGSGAGYQIQTAGSLAGGNVTPQDIISSIFQTLGLPFTQADQFADAAINGQSAWSILQPNTDTGNLFNLLWDLSQQDGNAYLMMQIYASCSTSPAGCPAELCAANPAACGLPTPITETEVPETPEPPKTCPAPTFSQAAPLMSIAPSGPAYPLAVGQDPDKRGVDISGQISIPPVILKWWEPVYDEENTCGPVGNGVSDCTRQNGNPGRTQPKLELKECKEHIEELPEQINTTQARAELSGDSAAWIKENLGDQWYGAYVHKASFNLGQYGTLTTGCGGSTCSANLSAMGVPFADPGKFNLTIMVGTNGTYWNGNQITQPRTLTTRGLVTVYIVMPSLIDASTSTNP